MSNVTNRLYISDSQPPLAYFDPLDGEVTFDHPDESEFRICDPDTIQCVIDFLYDAKTKMIMKKAKETGNGNGYASVT